MRNALPIFIAAADSAAILAYFLNIEPVVIQIAVLFAKMACLPWLVRRDSIAIVQLPILISFIALCLLSLIFASEPSMQSTTQVLGFLAHISLTLMLIVEELLSYFRWIAYICATSALVYLGFAGLGQIDVVWGRYYYFNGSHPNLGSEIATAGVLCGAISLTIRRFVLLTVPMFASAFVMQGRSALLTIALVVALRAAREMYTTSRSRRTQWWTIIMVPFAVAALIVGIPIVIDAMQLDNAYRGIDSGLGGRGDQWQMAWDAFMARPLTGQGLGWVTATQDLGAHQFFLYGLAEMGLLSVFVFLGMFLLAFRSFQIHGWKLVSIAPVVVMTMVNDRFINLNLYPYVLWIFLFALSARTWLAKPDEVVARPSSLRTAKLDMA
jgi:O-antigen ligase